MKISVAVSLLLPTILCETIHNQASKVGNVEHLIQHELGFVQDAPPPPPDEGPSFDQPKRAPLASKSDISPTNRAAESHKAIAESENFIDTLSKSLDVRRAGLGYDPDDYSDSDSDSDFDDF